MDKKILTIGGATQDIFLHCRGVDCMKITEGGGERNYMLFESGAKIEVEKIFYHTGGGATNSAVSFKRFGFNVLPVSMVGDDPAGKQILAELSAEGIDTSKIIVSREHSSGISYVINSLQNERTIFAYRGANGFLRTEDIPFDEIKKADQLYITSLSHESAKILREVVVFAKKHNVSVAINPGTSQLSKGTQELIQSLKYIDILILNSSEAKTFMAALVEGDQKYKKAFEGKKSEETCVDEHDAYLLKMPLLHENLYFSIANFFREAMNMGPKIVVVTDGARGVYVATGKRILFHRSLPIDVVDTVGAGDAFGSCFVGCLQRGESVESALRYGIVNSASVIKHVGAKEGLLSFKELEKRAKKIDSELLKYYEL